MDNFKRVMSVDDLAAYLSMPKATIYKLALEGKIPGSKVGRHWRFRRSTIDDWIGGETPRSRSASGSALSFAPTDREDDRSEDFAPEMDGQEGQQPEQASNLLMEFFTPEQIAILKAYWIEEAEQVIAIAATPSSLKGMAQALSMSVASLGLVTDKLKLTLSEQEVQALQDTRAGGSLGAHVGQNHNKND